MPNRPPTKKEAGDSGATMEEAVKLPWLPSHKAVCDGSRPCRPGEGNLRGYRMWGQPYIHREAWVQSKSRRMPHSPDPPEAHYAALVRAARGVARHRLVVMAAGDFDFREVVYNWHAHLSRLGVSNALVLAMDSELHSELSRRRIPSVDNSVNVEAWNRTCLQRHIQRVRMERQLALIAIVASGIDVLHTDATVVFTRDVLPMLRGVQPLPGETVAPGESSSLASADFITQREGGPTNAYRKIGSCVSAGFVCAHAISIVSPSHLHCISSLSPPARLPLASQLRALAATHT